MILLISTFVYWDRINSGYYEQFYTSKRIKNGLHEQFQYSHILYELSRFKRMQTTYTLGPNDNTIKQRHD